MKKRYTEKDMDDFVRAVQTSAANSIAREVIVELGVTGVAKALRAARARMEE